MFFEIEQERWGEKACFVLAAAAVIGSSPYARRAGRDQRSLCRWQRANRQTEQITPAGWRPYSY